MKESLIGNRITMRRGAVAIRLGKGLLTLLLVLGFVLTGVPVLAQGADEQLSEAPRVESHELSRVILDTMCIESMGQDTPPGTTISVADGGSPPAVNVESTDQDGRSGYKRDGGLGS